MVASIILHCLDGTAAKAKYRLNARPNEPVPAGIGYKFVIASRFSMQAASAEETSPQPPRAYL